MYSILLILQIISVSLSFACIVMLMVQKNTSIAKYMLLTCICCFIQNVGYLLEMLSTNLDETMMAVRFEYIGTAFILTCMIVFVCKYCKFRFVPWIKWSLFVIDIIVLISVWTYKYNKMFYTSVEFVDSGIMPHVVLGKGPLYILFVTVLFLEFVGGIVVSLITTFRTEDTNMRKNYILLTIACIIPIVFFISGSVGLIEGYDPAPFGGAIGILSFVFAIAFKHVFDVVESAHDNILMNLDEALIILDYRNGFQEANKKAYNLIPELSKTNFGGEISSEIIKNIIEEKGGQDVIINNRFYNVLFNDVVSNNMVIGHTILFFDMTENKRQITRLNELREAADTANQAKSTFLASVSHEIRTPINVVVGMSDVILRDFDDPKLLEYAKNIQEASRSLLALINDILDFSKIESGKTNLVMGDYEAKRFFEDVVNTYRHVGDSKDIGFDVTIDGDIPSVLYGDETRIRQVMTNLLSNAFKYTQKGEVKLKAAFEWVGEDNGNLILSVEDTGIGIKKGDIDKLFQIFVRLDERINRAIEGTGLGLNITKQLIELMNGEIKVYSEYGKGSVFTAIIPQVVHCEKGRTVGDISADGPKTVHRKKVSYTASNAEVLVVDDSKTNLIVAKALLRDTKVKVTTASSGFECLKLTKDKKFDVIFLDHRMPEMDGVETLHKLHESDASLRKLPIIMLTANAVSDAREYYLNEGFTDFLSKPITEDTITSMLEKYLPEDLID